MKIRRFSPSFPYALLATALIVGGAPPGSSGLTGCAAPAARLPVALPSERSPSPSLVASAPGPAEVAPLLAAANAEAGAPSVALAPESPVAPNEPGPPGPPPHVWKGGEFQRAVSQLAQWAKRNGGVLRAELDDVGSGVVLGSFAANTPENPASNQKILTTAAVLRHFGANFRFKTTLCGTRAGDSVPVLVLHGVGDPSLASQDLEEFAKALADSGVRPRR